MEGGPRETDGFEEIIPLLVLNLEHFYLNRNKDGTIHILNKNRFDSFNKLQHPNYDRFREYIFFENFILLCSVTVHW